MSTNANPVSAGVAVHPHWPLAAIILVASALLMILSARGDLAIDEVVSLNKALQSPGWAAIFTQDQNDNNHLLNTYLLRALGEQRHLLVYRIPAIVFGIAFVALMMVAARRFGKNAPLWAGVLAGFSYPVILYSSEARGYVPAMFFAVAAFELLQRCWEKCSWPNLLLFWTSLALGILAHFSFVMVCLALGIWAVARDLLARAPFRMLLGNALKLFAVPLVFLAVIDLFYIRHMFILGGQILSRWDAISDATTQLLGLAGTDGLRLASVVGASAFAAWAIVKLVREQRNEWIFFVAVLLLSPAFVLLVWQPKFLYFRYFSVCFPFFYLLLAYLFDGWFRQPRNVKWVPVILAAALTAGHLVKTEALIRLGRGNYRQALLDMAAATSGPVVRVASDHDFRNRKLLEFYARFLPPTKNLEYIFKAQRDEEKPGWVILHCLDPKFPAYPDIDVGTIGKYELFGSYPYCGSSGWSWFVYRRPVSADTIPAAKPQAAGAH